MDVIQQRYKILLVNSHKNDKRNRWNFRMNFFCQNFRNTIIRLILMEIHNDFLYPSSGFDPFLKRSFLACFFGPAVKSPRYMDVIIGRSDCSGK